MSVEQHKADNEQAKAVLAASVAALIEERGVPNSFDAMWAFVQNLMPEILAARQTFYESAVRAMGRSMISKGLEVSPAPIRPYEANAAWKLLARALRWNQNKHPIDGPITELDEATQRQITEKVVPFPEDPFDEEVVEQVTKRIIAAAITHAQQAGRDAIVDTAEKNVVRTAKTKAPVSKPKDELPESALEPEPVVEEEPQDSEVVDTWHPETPSDDEYIADYEDNDGVVLGWARVLTGEESCSFCAMLASRGPVYTKQTVLTKGNGTRYHDNCDCIAVLVIKGQHWEGHNQFRALQKLWNDSYETPDSNSSDARTVFSERYKQIIETEPEKFAIDVHESGVPGVRLPDLVDNDGNKITSIGYFGDEPEPIPSLRTLIKHSTWGWNRNDSPIDPTTTERHGHHYDSARRKGSFYPKSWDDQKIADAIAATVADPDLIGAKQAGPDVKTRVAVRTVDGITIRVEWKLNNGRTIANTAFPIGGPGVERWHKKQQARVPAAELQKNYTSGLVPNPRRKT